MDPSDPNLPYMLDGNAAAGMLSEIFSFEMTASLVECANCGQEGEVGRLLAFVQAPGMVLRCPSCENVILRVAQTPEHVFLDMRGSVYVRMDRQ